MIDKTFVERDYGRKKVGEKMNKYVELNKELQASETNLIEPYNSEVLDMVNKLVERATPIEPNNIIRGMIQFYKCPKCNNDIYDGTDMFYNYITREYCPYCGQALDWSDQ